MRAEVKMDEGNELADELEGCARDDVTAELQVFEVRKMEGKELRPCELRVRLWVVTGAIIADLEDKDSEGGR